MALIIVQELSDIKPNGAPFSSGGNCPDHSIPKKPGLRVLANGEQAQPAPPRPWITESVIRAKNPRVDLRRQYRKVLAICTGVSFTLHIAVVLAFPTFDVSTPLPKTLPVVIQIEDIPETRQVRRAPPLLRPALPIEVEDDAVPDDATIELTDLDFDRVAVDIGSIPAVPAFSTAAPFEEEKILDFISVEKKPELINSGVPKYPPAALRAGREGTVYVQFVVDKNGKVKNPRVVRGPGIFKSSALETVSRFLFTPALQDGEKVQVRMLIPIEFRLKKGR